MILLTIALISVADPAHAFSRPLTGLAVIAVWCTRRGNIAGNRHSAGVGPRRCRREGDTAAGELCTYCVSMSERLGNRNLGAAEPPDGSYHRLFGVCSIIDRYCLAISEAVTVGDWNFGCAHFDGRTQRSPARRANRCNGGSFRIPSEPDRYLLAFAKTCHGGNLDVGRTSR